MMQGFGLKTLLWATVLLLAAVTTCYSQNDCSQAESCDLCVGDSTLNLTDCVWRNCDNDNDTGCVSVQDNLSCNFTNDAAMCTVVETAAEGKSDSDSDSDDQSPEFSQAKFDMSSFVGGIILVLCLQAGGFFAMRFLKSKDSSTYDPIEQPQ